MLTLIFVIILTYLLCGKATTGIGFTMNLTWPEPIKYDETFAETLRHEWERI